MKYLYHGSKVLLKSIDPREAFGFGGAADCKNAVYAVEDINLAIPFAFTLKNLSNESIFKIDTQVNPPIVTLVDCDLNWDKCGYVYKLASDNFEKIDNHQWISSVSIKPIEIIRINPIEFKSWVIIERSNRNIEQNTPTTLKD
jgi:hypothetical protein